MYTRAVYNFCCGIRENMILAIFLGFSKKFLNFFCVLKCGRENEQNRERKKRA